jgi:polyisoprenoid-binding protein YceI
MGNTMKTTYKIDPAHSNAHFTVRHMMITNVRGAFSGVQGTIIYDPEDLAASSVDVTIDATTINTNVADRDTHLKSADFLDVEKFPTLTFKSTKVESAGGGDNKVTGALTIHGVTRDAVLDVEGPTGEGKDPWGNLRIGASASTKIKRSEFGLTWNAAVETGGVMVSDEVKIQLEISAIKA